MSLSLEGCWGLSSRAWRPRRRQMGGVREDIWMQWIWLDWVVVMPERGNPKEEEEEHWKPHLNTVSHLAAHMPHDHVFPEFLYCSVVSLTHFMHNRNPCWFNYLNTPDLHIGKICRLLRLLLAEFVRRGDLLCVAALLSWVFGTQCVRMGCWETSQKYSTGTEVWLNLI